VVEQGGKCIRVLHFFLQDVRCCLDLRYVEKILPLPMLETIPGSPVYFVGLMNLKHSCVPVFDLAVCTGLLREQVYSLNIPILLCTDGQHHLALIVDQVIGLGDVREDEIEIHEELAEGVSPFLGVVTLTTGVSLLMNSSWVFALKLTQEAPQCSADHE
jgi:purine-binding chemotaxis protein CheW